MSKLSRVFFRLFGGDGPTDDFAEFGSLKAGSPIKTKDVALIQSLDAWVNGWKDAVLTDKNLPPLEDMNGLFRVLAYMTAYQFQEGISEWDASTTYQIGSVVKRVGTFQLYGSLIADNQGNTLPSATDNANWAYIGNMTSGTMVPSGTILDFGGQPAQVPAGYLFCDGAAVSRASYPTLFAAIGVSWGPGNGSTTFNVPNLNRRVTVGSGGSASAILGNTVGSVGGEETHTQTVDEMPVHSHAYKDGTNNYKQNTQFGAGGTGFAPSTGAVDNAGDIGEAGGGDPFNIMQPSAVVLKIIKV